MTERHTPSLALIVRGAPYRNRVAREHVDFALAAAALDFEILVYFPGPAALQLLPKRDASKAQLPAGYRAWAALPGMTEARVFVEQQWLNDCLARGLEPVMPVEPLSPAAMSRSWRHCDFAVVL